MLAAGRHIPTWATAHRRRPDVRWSGDAPDLSTLGRAAAWLEAERPNLRAAVGYAAGSGRHLHAMQIPAAMGGFHHARGHWDQAAALYQTALTAARQAGDQPGQAGTLHDLGVMGKLTGDYTAAIASLAQAVALYGRIGDRAGPARPTPCASRAPCNAGPATTPPPSPALSRRWYWPAALMTCVQKPALSSSLVPRS